MKNLIVVTANCPTEEQEKSLDRCIDSVLDSGCHVALISHTHVPIHIQKKCNYYFYDYLNDTSDDVALLGHRNFNFNSKSYIQSRFFNKYFYGFAIYRMFSIASQIAINFGYKNIHHIEYDCELLDSSLIAEHSDYLEEYDSVLYTYNGKSDGLLFASIKSFKVSSLPDNFKNYNRDFIENEMKVVEPTYLEALTKNLFMDSGKVLFMSEPPLDRFKGGSVFHSRNLHFTLYYNSSDQTLNIFYKSVKESSEKIVVITNKNTVFNIQTKPYHWTIKSLGIFNEIHHVRVDNSEKIIYEQSFDNEFREMFKIKSYIKNE
jgi:hypothetical protein